MAEYGILTNPTLLELGKADQQEFDSNYRNISFSNSSPYYVAIRTDFFEDAIEDSPHFVIRPWSEQTLTLRKGIRRIAWKPTNKRHPEASNPGNLDPLFWLHATNDLMASAPMVSAVALTTALPAPAVNVENNVPVPGVVNEVPVPSVTNDVPVPSVTNQNNNTNSPNNNITNNIDTGTGKFVGVRGSTNTSQSIAAGAVLKIAIDRIDYEVSGKTGGFDVTTNKYTFPKTGRWLVGGRCILSTVEAGKNYDLRIYRSNVFMDLLDIRNVGSSQNSMLSGDTVNDFLEGETIDMRVANLGSVSQATVVTNSYERPNFYAVFLG